MPFCPECRSEYVAGHDSCTDCKVPLVDELPTKPEYELVEVYAAADLMEAQLLVSTLTDNEIAASVVDRRDTAFPTPTKAGRIRIAVPEGTEDQARELIDGARKDGVVGEGGSLLS